MRLGHVAVMVRDIDQMLDFYVETIGLQISDRGHTAGREDGPEIAFLSWDPHVVHHQLALIGVRRDGGQSNSVHHIAFEVDGLDELRHVWNRVKADSRATNLDPGFDGPATVFARDQWSIRLRDPEGNGIEIFAPTPWDARNGNGRYSSSDRAFDEFDIDLDEAALDSWGQEQMVGFEHWLRGQRPWPPTVERRATPRTRGTV